MSAILLVLASAVSTANLEMTPADAVQPTKDDVWASDERVEVDPRIVGWGIVGLGGVTLLVAGGLAIASAVSCAPLAPGSTNCAGNRDFAVAAGVTMGVGLGVISAGVVVINVPVAKAQVAFSPMGGTLTKTF